MNTIILKGWREGLDKVALSLLQVSALKLSLNEAKKNVDALLENEVIKIPFADLPTAQAFLQKAHILGADCEIATEELISV
ncbi:MAG: hypothetical protein EAZ95_13075 [Bacteroidetes bacterium]|nr:MAG: hypothetical protein EAZ95_13075 [Bacteroidota bacterium]